MTYYSLITTTCHYAKVKFTSTIDEFEGIKPVNAYIGTKDKTTYFNYFNTAEQAERFRESFLKTDIPINLKGNRGYAKSKA